jgi:hypothetical protein
LNEQIKKEGDQRYANMQGWVGEWVANLGKLAGLVTARSGTIVSSYTQFQKDYEISTFYGYFLCVIFDGN